MSFIGVDPRNLGERVLTKGQATEQLIYLPKHMWQLTKAGNWDSRELNCQRMSFLQLVQLSAHFSDISPGFFFLPLLLPGVWACLRVLFAVLVLFCYWEVRKLVNLVTFKGTIRSGTSCYMFPCIMSDKKKEKKSCCRNVIH